MENPQEVQEISQVSADELKYKKKHLLHPQYQLYNLYPLSGSQTQTITVAGSQEIIFQIPVKCINLSKSFLNFNMAPAADAGAGVFYYNKCPLQAIRQIQLYTQSGVYLADVYYVNKYLDVAFYAETPNKEFATLETLTGTDIKLKYGISTHKNNIAGTSVGAGVYAQRLVTDAAGNIIAAGTANAGTTAVSYNERIYVNAGTGVAADAVNGINVMFPMKYLYNTIFNVDRDLYFGEVLQLRVIFDGRDSTYFRANNANDVSAGAPLSMDQDINVSNISFYCAIEQDPSIASQLVEKVNTSGLTIPIPFVYSYKTNLSSTIQSLSLRFNRAHGKKLRRIYHAPYNNSETACYAYSRENLGGTKTVSQFYTLLNNERLQVFNVDCTKAQDWMLLRERIKDSTFVGADSYQAKWFWVDDFTSADPLCEKTSQDVIEYSSGVDLNSEQKWDAYFTMNNARALNHYNFAVTEKELLIRPGSIVVS